MSRCQGCGRETADAFLCDRRWERAQNEEREQAQPAKKTCGNCARYGHLIPDVITTLCNSGLAPAVHRPDTDASEFYCYEPVMP